MLSSIARKICSNPTNLLFFQASRGKKLWMRPYLISLYKRRIDQGPEPERPASAWINWNYEAELFSFGKRLGEDFNADTLKKAFVNKSYVDKEKGKRLEHGLSSDDQSFELYDNDELALGGEKVIEDILTKFVESSFKNLPKEGQKCLVTYLMSDKMLHHISSNLGVKDLVLTEEFPPNDVTMCKTFKAIIGALYLDKGYERCSKFIKDFIAVELVGKRVDDIWHITNPMGLLVKELGKLGMEEPESRLIWSSGTNTILANYVVGIYSNKKLLGKAPGETLTTAEEMAARDALRNLYQIQDRRTPLKF